MLFRSHKGDPARPRTKRTKEASGKRKGAKGEEMAREDRGEGPVKEKMFVTTDEQGRLKMLPVRARTTQLDEEPGASANANVQLSGTQPRPPLAQQRFRPLLHVPRLRSPWSPVGSSRTPTPISILLSHLSDTPRAHRVLLSWLSLENRVWQSETYQGNPSQQLSVDRWEIS